LKVTDKTYDIALHVPEDPGERQHLGRLYAEHGKFLLNGAVAIPDIAPGREADASTASSSSFYDGPDGTKRLRTFLTEVRAPKARRAIYHMANETLSGQTPDSMRIRELVGLPHAPGTPNNLGGVLTSVGFALRRLPGYTRPYDVFWGPTERATYRMERPVAEAIKDILDDQGKLL
jgi:hypothetical protein